MLSLNLDVWRVFIHIMAATIWVGGQLVLVGLLPVLRDAGDETPGAAARAFNRLAWPAFAVLVATGIWNLLEIPDDVPDGYHVTLGIKLLLVTASGIAAFYHARSSSRLVLALGGAGSFLGGVLALLLGVALTTGG